MILDVTMFIAIVVIVLVLSIFILIANLIISIFSKTMTVGIAFKNFVFSFVYNL